jgi:predicted nucleic acid-binding protein
MAWLLDTNILSEIRKPRPEPKVLAFIAGWKIRAGGVLIRF